MPRVSRTTTYSRISKDVTMRKTVIKKGDFSFRDLKRLTDRKFDLQVGLIGRDAQAKKRNYYGRPGSESLDEVAKKHEFGANNIPERSFIRSTFTKNKDIYKYFMVKNVQQAALLPKGKITATRKALNVLGTKMVKDIQKTIMMFIPPALHPKTMKKRMRAGLGFTPLLATRQLIQALKHKVAVTK